MSYIENNLLKDEKLIYFIRPHWVVFASSFWGVVLGLLVLIASPSALDIQLIGSFSIKTFSALVLFALAVYWFIESLIYFKTSEYGVTNKRVLIKIGWIQRTSLELFLDKVEGVLVDQSIIGRIFNYGTITIIGTGGTNDRFPLIPNPLEFRKNTQQQVELYEGHNG